MKTNVANLVRFTPLTKEQREINLLKLKKMEAEKAGNISLAKEIQFKIDHQPGKALTKDGTQLYAENGFVKGSVLQIVTPSGNITASEGKYELDTGEVIETDAKGVIISVGNPMKQLARNIKQLQQEHKDKQEKFYQKVTHKPRA